mgnify:CR=1 FL=1
MTSGNEQQPSWWLICPKENWQNPIEITERDLELLVELGRRLQLVVNRNEAQQKLYIGLPKEDLSTAAGLRFPSGWLAEVIEDGVAGPGFKAVDPLAAAPLISAFPDAQLSKNFRLSEFRPGRHSFPYVRISPALVRTLEEIRERAGGPVHITSGYRPPDYNREIGGVSNSTHIDGLAADIFCDALSTARLYDICEAIIGHRGGVGYYPKQQFVHVDLRGYMARWSGL